MKSLSFKAKILLLVVIPLLLVSAAITSLSILQTKKLADRNIETFSNKIFELRRDELRNYTRIAVSSLKHIYQGNADDPGRQEEAKALLRNLSFGQDGYFFAFDWNGTNVVHPQKPQLEGKNFWDLQDANGVYIMRSQVEQSRIIGGGYTDYVWEKTSLARDVDKISYSIGLDNWQWGIATGLYVDDLEAAVNAVQDEVNRSINNILTFVTGFALIFTLIVGFFGARLTLSESSLADNQLKELSRKVVVSQEEERSRVASRLNKQVNRGLNTVKDKLRKIVVEDEFKGLLNQSEFTSAIAIINKTMKEVNNISGDLRPTVLDDLGLYPAIEALLETVDKSSQVAFSFKKTVLGERLRSELETVIYRIVEEAVTNIIKHANASAGSIRIRQNNTLLHLIIRDDGVGFDKALVSSKSEKSATGITKMRLRAESVGGSFSLFSTDDNGSFTLITVQIPLI